MTESLEHRPNGFAGARSFVLLTGSTENDRQSSRNSTVYLNFESALESLADKLEQVSHLGFSGAAARETAEA